MRKRFYTLWKKINNTNEIENILSDNKAMAIKTINLNLNIHRNNIYIYDPLLQILHFINIQILQLI